MMIFSNKTDKKSLEMMLAPVKKATTKNREDVPWAHTLSYTRDCKLFLGGLCYATVNDEQQFEFDKLYVVRFHATAFLPILHGFTLCYLSVHEYSYTRKKPSKQTAKDIAIDGKAKMPTGITTIVINSANLFIQFSPICKDQNITPVTRFFSSCLWNDGLLEFLAKSKMLPTPKKITVQLLLKKLLLRVRSIAVERKRAQMQIFSILHAGNSSAGPCL